MTVNFENSWIKVPPPYPPHELFCLAERTAAGLSTLSSINAEQKLNRARQIALQALGKTTLDALASYVLYTQMHVTSAVNLSRILNSLNVDFSQSLAESVVNESQLNKGKSETNSPVEVRTRLIGAFWGVIGAYCFAEMCDALETVFMPILTAAINKRHPHIQDGLYEVADYKTALQEFTQQRSKSQPVYEIIQEEGPDHDKSFTVRVTAKSIGTAVGAGRSKKAAEQAAAKSFLLPFIQKDPSIIRKRENRGTRVIHKSASQAKISQLRQKEVPIEAVIKSLCRDDKLLHQALTHTSVAREFQIPDTTGLATLGDWLIRAFLTRKICKAFWDQAAINEINVVLSVFYREDSIARLFDEWNLKNRVFVGGAQTRQGCTSEMKETFVQAIAGACYVDANNLSTALQRMDDNLNNHIELTLNKFRDSSEATIISRHLIDPKTTLQELTQISGNLPEYTLVSETGPAHKSEFKSGVKIRSSIPNTFSPWLIGAFAPTKTKAEESAARSYLGLARELIKGGKPSALSLFRNQSRAAVGIVDQIAELLLQTILCADGDQQDFLQRTGLSLLASMTDDLNVVVNRLAHVDAFIQSQKRELESSPRFLSKAAVPLQTAAEIESIIGSLSAYLGELKPEQWAETGKMRRTILERLLGLTNLLKQLTEREEIRDLTEVVRQMVKSGYCIFKETDATEPFLVCGMRGFLDWFFTELCSELTSESIVIRLSPTDRTLEIEAPNSIRETKSLPGFVDSIVKCSDALLFGAGVRSCALTESGLRFVFINSQNGPLVAYFLQEG
jgi:ribonuclease III